MKTPSDYFDASTLEKAQELIEFVKSESPFTVKDANVSSQNLQYWIKQGLFPDKGDWAIRMDFSLFVWLRLLSELRTIGVGTKALEALYKTLFRPMDEYSLYAALAAEPQLVEDLGLPAKEKRELTTLLRSGEWKQTAKREKQLTFLLLLIAEAIAKRTFVSIAVFPSGEFVPLVDQTLHLADSDTQLRLKTQTHCVVSITQILSGIIGQERFSSILPQLQVFSDEETKLLEQVRSGEYDSIKIRFSNKRMDILELEKHEDVHQKLVDILSQNSFQSISISQQHGKISRITRSVKIKF